jgi:biopolymer transport protein ExbD
MHYAQKPRDSKRLAMALASLVSVLFVAALLHALTAPSLSVESQIYSALGCRSSSEVLVLTLNPDGTVRWPDGTVCTIEESQLLIPSWCNKQESPVLAILADKDTPMSRAHPLLATVQELDIRRAILAVSQGNTVAVLSDERGKTHK